MTIAQSIHQASVDPAPRVPKLTTLETILDVARWAPSGDNTQVWRFEIVNHRCVVVHGFDTWDHCVYDVHGRPSQIALGALLENVRIAASTHGLRAEVARDLMAPERTPRFEIKLIADATVQGDPLAPFIPVRSVQRRPMKRRALTATELSALEDAVRGRFDIAWLPGIRAKVKMALLLSRAARLRLTAREAYEVHRAVIAWNATHSHDRVPDQSVGLDPLSLRVMRWGLASFDRVEMLNRYFGGTIVPRIELDILPALACAGHFVLRARTKARTVDDWVAAGSALQRLWLTATSLGLQLQPEFSPLSFTWHAWTQTTFGAGRHAAECAGVAHALVELLGEDIARSAVFIGRIGEGPAPRARSVRRSLEDLSVSSKDR